jgi:hypothetical protein
LTSHRPNEPIAKSEDEVEEGSRITEVAGGRFERPVSGL